MHIVYKEFKISQILPGSIGQIVKIGFGKHTDGYLMAKEYWVRVKPVEN
jgi:hypothetical protein